jgi:hypothetical protein
LFCPKLIFLHQLKVHPSPQNYPTPKTHRLAPSMLFSLVHRVVFQAIIALKLKGLFELLAKFNQSKNILGF